MSLLGGGGGDVALGVAPLTPGGGGGGCSMPPSASWLADGPYSGIFPSVHGGGLTGMAEDPAAQLGSPADMFSPDDAGAPSLAAAGTASSAAAGSRLRMSHGYLSPTDYTAAMDSGSVGAGASSIGILLGPAAAEASTHAAPAAAASAASGGPPSTSSTPSRLRACLTNWGRKRIGSLGRR